MVLEDAYTPVEKITEKQSSRRCSAQCALRVVIGFNPIGCLDKDEGKKFLPVTTPSPSPSPSPSEKQSKSSKSGLTSSFETLLSSPRPQGNKDLQTVGLAIDSDRGICRGRIPSHTQHKFEEGRPIAIAQSELHHPVDAQSKLQRLPSHKERPVTALSQAPTRIFEGFVNGDLNVERCVFSFLSTCPETSEAQDDTLPLATMDFMDACFLCKRQLGEGRDIFMYKGDKAFCSEDCRYQQIVIDDRAERQEKFPYVALKTGKSVQSHRSNYRTKVLSASTAAAA